MRVQMRVEIGKLHNQLETTMIYVTHDQVEAMTMGDRICVMKDGVIHQVDEPTKLYDNPANKFVAGFIGTPPMNFFPGRIVPKDGAIAFAEGGFEFAIPPEWRAALGAYTNQDICFGIRPEDVGSNQAEHRENTPRIKATVEVVEPMGSETYVYLTTGKTTFISRLDPHRQCRVGDVIELALFLGKAHFFDTQTDKQIPLPR
jgi:multiple sugar transport system ATP-binding protein